MYVYIYVVISNGQKSFSKGSINTLSKMSKWWGQGILGWQEPVVKPPLRLCWVHGIALHGGSVSCPAFLIPSHDWSSGVREWIQGGCFWVVKWGGMCPHSAAGAGLPSFPRLCGATGTPPITCMSVLICLDVLFSLSMFGRGNFAFPLLLESTQLLEEGSFNPNRHVWPLLSPDSCRIGDRPEGSFQVLVSHNDLDQALCASVPGWRDGCLDTAWCSLQELLYEETPAQSQRLCISPAKTHLRGLEGVPAATWGGSGTTRLSWFQDYAEMLLQLSYRKEPMVSFFLTDRRVTCFKGQVWYKCYLVLRQECVPCAAFLSWKPLGGQLHTWIFTHRLSANVIVPVESLVLGNILWIWEKSQEDFWLHIAIAFWQLWDRCNLVPICVLNF